MWTCNMESCRNYMPTSHLLTFSCVPLGGFTPWNTLFIDGHDRGHFVDVIGSFFLETLMFKHLDTHHYIVDSAFHGANQDLISPFGFIYVT